MNLITQVLAILCWIVIGLALVPMLWLLAQPYIVRFSPAQRRARKLLREVLTPEQLHQLIWRGYLEVPSATNTQRVYRIPKEKGYVQVVENGRATMRLCLQPVECLPDADLVALHKLMIEANEDLYMQRANKYLNVE
jgi:hypothetical protein